MKIIELIIFIKINFIREGGNCFYLEDLRRMSNNNIRKFRMNSSCLILIINRIKSKH